MVILILLTAEEAKDQIWSGLGFVLQWAINGLKKK